MINDNIHPIDPTGFRFPTETELAIDETLKLCGISGEDASMIAIEVMKKLGKGDEIPACCRGLADKQPEIIQCKDCKWFRRWIDTEIEFCDLTESTVFATDYCSKAERKEEE